MNPIFSVFTPVYNRKNVINRVFNSRIKQTFTQFEWIVVDDGSSDKVKELIDEYAINCSFRIIFLRQNDNKGKHFAWNIALDHAVGELFVPADSDDEFDPDTLEFFFNKWNELNFQDRVKYSGINVLCKSNEGVIVGDKYPYDGFISNNLDLYYKYRINGEKWGCIRTDLLRQYRLPEIIGRGSYIMNYIWFSIAKSHAVLCYNKALRVYDRDVQGIANTQINFFKRIEKSSFVWQHY